MLNEKSHVKLDKTEGLKANNDCWGPVKPHSS